MRIDALTIKRLNELAEQTSRVKVKNSPYGRNGVDHEGFHSWAIAVMNVLKNIFGENSVHYEAFSRAYSKFNGWEEDFHVCMGIFIAAKEDFQGGYIFNFKSLVRAEIADDFLEQAEELLRAGYKDPACIITGVTLETTLKNICEKRLITIGKLDKMNADLCKAGTYNIGMQKQITAWADRRNNAAHGRWDSYTKEDVKDMIRGVKRFMAEYL